MTVQETLVKMVPIRKANSALFHYRTNRWRWNARFRDGADEPLDRPIYLVGTQGGGLTLLSRVLHRHRHAVSVTGNSSNWAGEDEAQNALEPVLPEDFGWRRVDVPGYPSRNHSWVYANDDFLAHYRRRAEDAVPEAGARYRAIIGGAVRMHARDDGPSRFVDKSQSLTVRVGFVHALLGDCSPSFVLMTRNPYALVWSQATGNRVVSRLDRSIEDRVRICAQHWRNSFAAALEDAERNDSIHLRTWQFETMLCAPKETVGEICDFVDLPRDDNILPGPHDRIPWGSRHDAFNRRKWYPLRPDVNDRYLSSLPDWARDIIAERCGDLMQRFGYDI